MQPDAMTALLAVIGVVLVVLVWVTSHFHFESDVMTALLLVVFVASVYFAWPSDEWSGFVYPDADDLTNHLEIGEFESLGECSQAAQSRIRNEGWRNADYECGSNCRPFGTQSLCEETLR